DRVRKGELFGFAEIGPDVFATPPTGDAGDDRYRIRYQTNRATHKEFPALLEKVVNEQVQKERGGKVGLKPEQVQAIVRRVARDSRGLTTRDPVTQQVKEADEQNLMAAFLAPFGLMMLMFMNTLMTATPLMQGVVEEKMQRIAEVLL